jgi:hypothetical protein
VKLDLLKMDSNLNIKFDVDKDFLINLILQRTLNYLNLGGAPYLQEWFNNGNRDILLKLFHEKDKFDKFMHQCLNEIYKDYLTIQKYLTKETEYICSIGPGNCIFELFLLKNLIIKKILLIDIEQTNDNHHGFQNQGSGYANLESSKRFLISNGINPESIDTCNPLKENMPNFKFDILISIISMGFHYPCDQYAKWININCKNNGLILFDKRKKVVDDGFELLKNTFSIKEQLEYIKHHRIILSKKVN